MRPARPRLLPLLVALLLAAPLAAPAPSRAQGYKPQAWTANAEITAEDLAGMTPRDLALMRHEIYARHGWTFDDPELTRIFATQAWYKPAGDNAAVALELTPVERRNLAILKDAEAGILPPSAATADEAVSEEIPLDPGDAPEGDAPATPPARERVSRPAPAEGGTGIFPWTSRRAVTRADMDGLSNRDLDLMRNEIYARHGWVFQRADLRNHFAAQPWYRPLGDNRRAERSLSALERSNVETIRRRQQGR